MRRLLKRIGIALAIIMVVCVSGAWWALQQTKQIPEFYAEVTRNPPDDDDQQSMQLKADVRRLQADAAQQGSWNARFSDRQINAWLSQELPKKFSRLLAKGMSDPRIVIQDDRVLIAARYQDKRIDTVVSMEIKAELTEEPNMLALRVQNLRAGALPLPLDRFLKGITREAARGDVEVRWDFTDEGPVALVTVPSQHPKYVVNPVVIESVRFMEGRLELSGHSGPVAEESYRPRGPIHRFVSYRPSDEKRKRQASSLKQIPVKLR